MREYHLYIADISDCIKRIKLYTKKLSFEQFLKDEMCIDAVIRNFEIIGEASRQLPKEIRAKHSEVNWRDLIAFRNVIIHEYFGINQKIMWDIIQNELPPLGRKINALLKSFPRSKI
jgi:uncharacterized protein with HEPN domain